MFQVENLTPEAPALDTAAAARYLGMRPTTLRSWRRRDRGPSYWKFDTGTVRYSLKDLERFVHGYAVPSLSEEALS